MCYAFFALTVLATVFSMAWYKIVMQHSLLVYHRKSHLSLVFSWYTHSPNAGGVMASWLVRSFPGQAVRVRALARDIVLCSWARHFTFTVPLSTQVYKWLTANLMLGVTLRWTSMPSRGSRNTPSRFILQKLG